MKNKKIIVILGAVLIVLVLAIFLFPHFKAGYMGATESVVIASSNISRGTIITADMVKQQDYPSTYLGKEAVIIPQEAVIGQYAAVDICASDIITKPKIVADGDKAFFDQNNLVAITTANLASSVAAKLKVGDKVNVYGYYTKDNAGGVVQPPILQNMEIANVISSDAQEVSDGIAPAAIVLKVTSPEQAQALIELEYTSKIHLERVSNNAPGAQ